MNISGPAAVAKPEMLFYAPGDLTVTFDFYKIAYHIEQAPPAVDSSIWNIYCRWGF